MSDPDKKGYGEAPREIKGFLLMTRADHLRVGSTPPIDSKFGDNVCRGDTLDDEALHAYYQKKLGATKKMLNLDPEAIKNFRETQFLDPEWFAADLEYCRRRGVDVSEGKKLLEELKNLK